MSQTKADINLCNRCGYCQSECPVFRETGLERMVARGRIDFLRNEGANSPDALIKDVLYDCTLCGKCAEGCPLGVDVPSIILKGREQLQRERRTPFLMPAAMSLLLPRPQLLRFGSAALRLYDASGLRRLSGWLGVLPGQEGLLPRRVGPSYRSRRPAGTPSRGQLTYFLGCATDFFYPQVAQAVEEVLTRSGRPAQLALNHCCGLPALVYGNRDLAEELARKNIAHLEGAGTVVTDCATCASALKDYPRLLADDPTWLQRAQELSRRVMGFSELMLEMEVQAGQPPGDTATIHYPCHLVRHQHMAKDCLHGVLQGMKGLELRPMTGADECCGGAGTYVFNHPRLGQQIGSRKADWFRQTGADLLVTECPACMSQLSRFLPGEARVLHTAQLVAGRTGS